MNKDLNTNIEGLEIITESVIEIDKEEFYKMLLGNTEGLTLTIDRLGKVFQSKYPDTRTNSYPYGCFIDYTFTTYEEEYQVGIYYNLGVPTMEDYDIEGNPIYKFTLTKNMNIFRILSIAVDLEKATKIGVSESFLRSNLTGIKFQAVAESSNNGRFYIEPIELLES